MRRIFKRLTATSSSPETHGEADQTREANSTKPGVDGGRVEITSGEAVVGITNIAEPGINVPTPDVDVDAYTPTVPSLVLADESPPANTDKSRGFNPYDSGVFQKK